MTGTCATSNPFPQGECTHWASERYHQLAGCYVPWRGNAKDWSHNASPFGWYITVTPFAPSIICLQGGVQGADNTYGHVAVCESVEQGFAHCSSLNWGFTPAERSVVSHQVFKPGPGVSFIAKESPHPAPSGVLSANEVAGLALAAGFTGDAVDIAVAVAHAESSFRLAAVNHNTNGTIDRGLWQINSVHSQYNGNQLLSDGLYNAKAAYQISSGGKDWHPWTTYNNGAYKKYLGEAPAVTPCHKCCCEPT